jgi:hypothetical protein
MSVRSKVFVEVSVIAVLTALGTAFYYGLFGHDLAAEWRTPLP